MAADVTCMTGNECCEKSMVYDVLKRLKQSKLLSQIRNSIQVEIEKASPEEETGKLLDRHLDEAGYVAKLQNMVYSIIKERSYGQCSEYEEKLVHLKKAQKLWEKCIINSINGMCKELAIPLARKRSEEGEIELCAQFESMTLGEQYNDGAYANLRPVYSSSDFLEVMTSIENENYAKNKRTARYWGLLQVHLSAPLITDIIETYKELCGCKPQMGLDDLNQRKQLHVSFEKEWTKLGEAVIGKQLVGAARQFLKQGCPVGLRKKVWNVLLDLQFSEKDKLYFEQLKKSVYKYDMMVDHLIMKDVRLTIANNNSFFVFEDVLYQVLLAFSRDAALLKHFKRTSATPTKSNVEHKSGVEDCCVPYPPCGIFPFHGFSMLAAPLCYIYEQSNELYFVFRELYSCMFFRLHTISSHPEGILSICVLFEHLLQSEDPLLMSHMVHIGAHPVQIVFNWFLFAYSGYLATEQILQLWDRLLGYNSFHLLAVLAVAILRYRRDNLMSVTNRHTAEAVLADISTIKVIPLLVYFLSGKEF